MYFGKAQIEITGLLHVPILDVPVDAELRGAQLDVTDLVAGDEEDGLIVQGHGEHILVLVLDEVLERLVLGVHVGGGVGGVDQAVELGVLRGVGVGGGAGAVA